MDQLSNFVIHSESSPLAQPMHDGPTSSEKDLGSRPRLNPAFGCWLMGLPIWWTNPAVTNSVQSEMAQYLSASRLQLQRLLAKPESNCDSEAA